MVEGGGGSLWGNIKEDNEVMKPSLTGVVVVSFYIVQVVDSSVLSLQVKVTGQFIVITQIRMEKIYLFINYFE